MTRPQRFLIVASIITCYLIQAQGADKYTDENRPYEFGFTIDGQQHRHEEKDKNGIIKGEYGFITADGVYHVTVYATDAQGRFRILSMKNIRYKDYKGLTGPPSSARQPHSLQLPSPKVVTAGQPSISNSIPTPKPQQEFEQISILPPANSCSHCSLPTTSTVAPKIESSLINQQNGGGNSQYNPSFYPKEESNYNAQSPQAPGPQQVFTQGSNAPTQPNNYNSKQPNAYYGAQNSAQIPSGLNQQNNYNLAQNSAQGQSNGYNSFQGSAPAQPNSYNGAQSSPQQPNGPGNYGKPNGFQGSQGYGSQTGLGGQQGQQSSNAENPRMSKQYTGTPDTYTPGQQNPALDTSVSQARPGPNQKPVLAYAQMQIVDKNTDIHAKAPGEKDGLPPGLKEDDMLKLLYTFNYTLGFQAHFEEGFTNGVKRGYYYTTGRNGVRTRIDYVADNDGFHPKLSQEVYDLISDDVPKEDTEKDEKYGLKGYEFKWLYFPVETKSQQSST